MALYAHPRDISRRSAYAAAHNCLGCSIVVKTLIHHDELSPSPSKFHANGKRCISHKPQRSQSVSTSNPPLADALTHARAYLRVDQAVIQALPGLDEAIRSFKPVPGPAGESVARWLSERAFRAPQEATVRLRLSHGRVTGVYALCAAQVALATEERAQLGGVHYLTQPAILLAQLARAADAPGIGDELLRHAAAIARRALTHVGATVLVVDPFDEPTADMWRERFAFQDSRQPVPGNPRLRRQWLRL
jgi:hypothetical protein